MKLTIKDHPTGGPRVEFEEDGRDIFVVVNGVTIARHTYPDTSAAGTWVSLEPGWTVTSSEDLSRIEIMYDGKQVSFDGNASRNINYRQDQSHAAPSRASSGNLR